MTIPKNVTELTEMMEATLPTGIETNIYLAVTGEPYFAHCYGIRGLKGATLDGCEARIVEALWNDFLAQVEEKSVLYWRQKPEYGEEDIYLSDGREVWKTKEGYVFFDTNEPQTIDEKDVVKEPRAKVYMRYLVSSVAPQVPKPISPPETPIGAKEEGAMVKFI